MPFKLDESTDAKMGKKELRPGLTPLLPASGSKCAYGALQCAPFGMNSESLFLDNLSYLNSAWLSKSCYNLKLQQLIGLHWLPPSSSRQTF